MTTDAPPDRIAPPPASGRTLAPAVLLALIPALLLWVGSLVSTASGPRWLYPVYDPDYQYLLNAVNLVEGAAPRHTDHPGTTVQELGAGVLAARHIITGHGRTIREEALQEPEPAMTAISAVIRSLYAATIFSAGLLSWRWSRSLTCAVASQLAGSLSMVGLVSLWRVDPEPTVMLAAAALVCTNLAMLRRPAPLPARALWPSGVVAGLGVATKMTFLPLLILPLWAVRTRRSAAVYLASTAASFLIAVSPILGQTRRVLGWLGGIFIHDGKHGSSHGHPIIDTSRYLFNVRLLVWAEPVAATAAAACLLLVIHARFFGRWREVSPAGRTTARALTFLCIAEFAQYILVAKHYGNRYMAPITVLPALNATLAYILLRAAYSVRERRVACSAALAALAATSVWIGDQLRADLRTLSLARDEMLSVRRDAEQRAAGGALITSKYGSSSPIYALVYADGWTGKRYHEDLCRMFPNEVTVDEFKKNYALGGRDVTLEQVTQWAAEGRLFFQCGEGVLPAEFEFKRVFGPWGEGVFQASPRAPAAQPATPP